MTESTKWEGPYEYGDVVDHFWPYDGPHSVESVTYAARALEQLVRYLNNATRPSKKTLAYAATSNQVLGSVSTAVHGLDQLLSQVTYALDQAAGDPTLYDDRHDRSAVDTAGSAAGRLAEARFRARDLASELDGVRELTNHLGNNTDQ
jgi:hypothetical protein